MSPSSRSGPGLRTSPRPDFAKGSPSSRGSATQLPGDAACSCSRTARHAARTRRRRSCARPCATPSGRRPDGRHRHGLPRGLPRRTERRDDEGERLSARAVELADDDRHVRPQGDEPTNGMRARSRSSASRRRRARPPRPHLRSTRRRATSRRVPGRASWSTRSALDRLEGVELAGLEPATSWVRSRRSPS